MAKKKPMTGPTWPQYIDKVRQMRGAGVDERGRGTPNRRDVRGVIADFINERVTLPGGHTVTPDWIGRNHDLAVKLVGHAAKMPKINRAVAGPGSAHYAR